MSQTWNPPVEMTITHTPGPWHQGVYKPNLVWSGRKIASQVLADCSNSDDARLIAAAPDMLAALRNVQKLISEAAMTGFNWKDGDWAERLFASQQVTSDAIRAATGRHK